MDHIEGPGGTQLVDHPGRPVGIADPIRASLREAIDREGGVVMGLRERMRRGGDDADPMPGVEQGAHDPFASGGQP